MWNIHHTTNTSTWIWPSHSHCHWIWLHQISHARRIIAAQIPFPQFSKQLCYTHHFWKCQPSLAEAINIHRFCLCAVLFFACSLHVKFVCMFEKLPFLFRCLRHSHAQIMVNLGSNASVTMLLLSVVEFLSWLFLWSNQFVITTRFLFVVVFASFPPMSVRHMSCRHSCYVCRHALTILPCLHFANTCEHCGSCQYGRFANSPIRQYDNI